MTRRRSVAIPPFSPLELNVLRALSWELQPQFRDAENLVDEATPGRWFQGESGFVRRTGLAGTRPGRQRGESGVFGSIHAVIRGLAEPVLFQLQLRRGRLIALMADAYGQDVSHIDFHTARAEQLFYIDEHGRSMPLDERLLTAQGARAGLGGRAGHTGRGDTAPRNVVIETVSAPAPQAVQRPTPVPRQSGLVIEPSRAERSLQDVGQGAERGLLKLAIWIVVLTVAALAWILFRFPIFLALILAFWIGRAMTKGPGFQRMEAAFNRRQQRLMN